MYGFLDYGAVTRHLDCQAAKTPARNEDNVRWTDKDVVNLQ